MIPADRDKVRLHAYLTSHRGEAFTTAELSKVMELPAERIRVAGGSLVAAGMAKHEEDYFWVDGYVRR